MKLAISVAGLASRLNSALTERLRADAIAAALADLAGRGPQVRQVQPRAPIDLTNDQAPPRR